jgi:aminopeptidase
VLNAHAFVALHLRAPGTDLRVGLADTPRLGVRRPACGLNGAFFVANMPTEEVFTAPHARRVDGTVARTKPLSYQGQLIDGFSLTFEDGAVVDYGAERGEAVLQGCSRSTRAPAAWARSRWCRTRARSARAGCCSTTRSSTRTPPATSRSAAPTRRPCGRHQAAARGAERDGFNQSLTHVDFMFGSEALDIDGELPDGALVPVMRGGAWAF